MNKNKSKGNKDNSNGNSKEKEKKEKENDLNSFNKSCKLETKNNNNSNSSYTSSSNSSDDNENKNDESQDNSQYSMHSSLNNVKKNYVLVKREGRNSTIFEVREDNNSDAANRITTFCEGYFSNPKIILSLFCHSPVEKIFSTFKTLSHSSKQTLLWLSPHKRT